MSRTVTSVVVALAVLVVVVGAALGTIALRGFSAREEPGAVETFVALRLRNLAMPPEARNRDNPLATTELAVAEGRDHFADHCAVCHANDGSGRTQINAGMYPPAPDMRTQRTQELTDGQIFYVIKNGVRFTGMPGWGGEDEENWKLVLFIRHLPKIMPKEIDLMREINQLEIHEEETGDHHSR
ncbi:MAG: c-type cytochrome [Bryobacteraceae bacterium]